MRCFIHSGYCNKNTINCMAYKQQMLAAQSSAVWEVQDHGADRGHWICRVKPCSSLAAILPSQPPLVEEGNRASWTSFMMAIIPLMTTLALWANHLPKAPIPHTINLGIKISTHEFLKGYKHLIYGKRKG